MCKRLAAWREFLADPAGSSGPEALLAGPRTAQWTTAMDSLDGLSSPVHAAGPLTGMSFRRGSRFPQGPRFGRRTGRGSAGYSLGQNAEHKA